MSEAIPSIDVMEVVHEDDGWALMVDDLDTPAWVVDTRKKAVQAGRDAAEFHNARLVVHNADGSVHREFDFAS